jgi:hypothetical protein
LGAIVNNSFIVEQIVNSEGATSYNHVKEAIEKNLPIFASIWFFVVLNSYLVWTPLAPAFHFFPALLILWGTFLLSDKLSPSRYNRIFFLCITIYYIWMVISRSESFASVIKISTDFVPFLCIILWPTEQLYKTYHTIRKVIVFFAIGSAILSVLILLGLHEWIPHLVLPAREALHERLGIFYHLYIFFVADVYPVMGVSPRACGMLQEPGHFSILLGFIYLIDRLSGLKINKGIIICGLMTFSSTFVLIVLFTEIHHLLSWKGVRKITLFMFVLLLIIIGLYFFLPTGLKDQLYHFAYGRNLEKVVEAFNETSSLTGALDERANNFSIAYYEKMSTMQYFLGGGTKNPGYALSDYRGMILNIGFLGMILAIISYLSIFINTPFKLKIALALTFFLVLIHRSWMLFQPYLFFQAFMAVITYRMSRESI